MTIEERIRSDIEQNIRAGIWKPGHRIPFEYELVAQYGCARATVSKALTTLARQGLIDRRRKAGSFVALQHVQSAALEIPDIGAIIRARGEDYSYELIERHVRPVDRDNPDEDLLAATGNVLVLTGLHRAGERPFAAEDRQISLSTVPEAEATDFGPEAPGSWLLQHVPWSDARHRISAISAGRHYGSRLGIPASEACLSLERWTWRQGAPVTFVRQVFPGSLHDLVAEFRPRGIGHPAS